MRRPSPLSAPILIVTGPTASGKSGLAMAVAERRNGVVINADAMQVYQDLSVLTARPTAADEDRVPHRLYGVLDGREACSAVRWRNMAVKAIEETLSDGRLPILCGGTGLYLKALTDGLSAMPDIPRNVREKVREQLAENGAAALHQALRTEDPVMAARLCPTDPQRLARALEVIRATGRSLYDWQRQAPTVPPPKHWAFTTIALLPPREELYACCNARLDWMLKHGALEEVRALRNRNLSRNLPVMRALGVPELLAVLEGRLTLDAAKEKIRTATRRYAKRQMTWIRHQTAPDIIMDAPSIDDLFSELQLSLRK